MATSNYFVSVDDLGNTFWYKDQDHTTLHRVGGPAITAANGDLNWYQDGELHREDGPAVMFPSGYQAWYRNGKLHREDGPAVILSSGRQLWFLKGKQMSQTKHAIKTAPAEELTVAQIEALLGKKIKIINSATL